VSDPSSPSRSPRRVADLLRVLSAAADREQAARRSLREAAWALLDAPPEGPSGLASVVGALGASAAFDACALVVRDGATWVIVAAHGLEPGAPFELLPGSLAAEVARRRDAALGAGARAAAPPLPPGTRFAAAAPIVSRGELLGLALAGSRASEPLGADDLLLVRLAAERAGRALERHALVESLAGAEAVARKTDAFRDQILAIVGHDLRNPLGAIMMSAALLAKRGALGGWQHKTISRVRSSAARMHRIIDDLLGYTRTRLGGGIPIVRCAADLGELARRVVDELVAFHPERPIHVEAGGDLVGEWDPARLEQVLSNLVSNALDHGEDEQRIEVALRGEPDRVEVEIVNRGEMPPIGSSTRSSRSGARRRARPAGSRGSASASTSRERSCSGTPARSRCGPAAARRGFECTSPAARSRRRERRLVTPRPWRIGPRRGRHPPSRRPT
jgi:signal transduction histidine kinase